MIDRIVTDAVGPLSEALKGADAIGVAPSRINVRFRRDAVVVNLADQVPTDKVEQVWELLKFEFVEAGWGFRVQHTEGFASIEKITFDHPSTFTTLGR
jgi:hypothetical protein